MLAQRWANAEQRYLDAGLVDDAISANLACHKWPAAIRIAEAAHHEEASQLQAQHMEHLLATGQLAAAGRSAEASGDIQVRLAVPQFSACTCTALC